MHRMQNGDETMDVLKIIDKVFLFMFIVPPTILTILLLIEITGPPPYEITTTSTEITWGSDKTGEYCKITCDTPEECAKPQEQWKKKCGNKNSEN